MQENSIAKRDFLAQHGTALLDNGYAVVPIQPGKKAPGFDGWSKATQSKSQIKEWLGNGHRNSGVGILTKHTPAIDIDVRDDDIAERVEQWVIENIGDAPTRVGRAPKRLMVFRTDSPFKKMRSGKWKDQFGDEHQIEILADGQQFVAYHIHPDTGKPYTWPSVDRNPLQVPVNRLIPVTVDQCQALINWFDQLAFDEGWEEVKKGRNQAAGIESDNVFVEDTFPVSIDDDELQRRLMLVPDPDDHDHWVNVGMALHHQYDGDETGLAMWHEWSETADNYDADALERRWKSFAINGKKRAPITARYIIKLAREAADHAEQQLALELRDKFINAKTLQEWDAARVAARESEIDSLARSALALIAKERRDAILGAKTPLVEIKKAIAFAPRNADNTPKWCEGWLYDTSADRFFHGERKNSVTQQGFNAMYDRRALTKKDIVDGKSSPSQSASSLALNLYKITTVDGTRYMPGNDTVYSDIEGTFANLYAEHEIPEVPDTLSPRDKQSIERVKAHVAHLLPEEEGRMFVDWMSWIVQNPGKHANYAVLLQGVEGDGKTFFAEMLRAVMGVSNVTMLNAQILHSSFTDWTVGQCLACVEEVRLVNDGNKFEVLNRVKPYITNTIIEVHPKGKAVYNAINTTSYLLFSNYKDALPLDDNARRYLILFSRWQSRERIRAFKAGNRKYYSKLYETLETSAGALRHWLLNHEQDEDFDPVGDAPETAAKKHMVFLAKPEFIQMLDQAIERNESHLVGPEVVTASGLHEIAMMNGVDYPSSKALSNMMARAGHETLGKIRVGDEITTVWVRDADAFTKNLPHGVTPGYLVREELKRRKEALEDDEL